MNGKTFKSLFDDARRKDTFHVEQAILQFTSDLYQLMLNRGLTKAELARALGTSPAYITKVFRGDANFTIESMVKLTNAIDGQLHLHVAPREHEVHWLNIRVGAQKTHISLSPAWAQKQHVLSPAMKESPADELEPAAA
jgi:transcriptional regulator with XRE-family HTH domain